MFLRKKLDINVELEAYRRLQHANMNHGAILLDVRTPREHKAASLSGSVNLPLNQLKSANKVIPALDTPVFVYCATGARADRAVKRLKRAGYTNIRSIGGLEGYHGEIIKG